MLARELIELLQTKIKEHEPYEEMFGELTVHVDSFEQTGSFGLLLYKGLSPDISLEVNSTGFLVIGPKESENADEGQIAY